MGWPNLYDYGVMTPRRATVSNAKSYLPLAATVCRPIAQETTDRPGHGPGQLAIIRLQHWERCSSGFSDFTNLLGGSVPFRFGFLFHFFVISFSCFLWVFSFSKFIGNFENVQVSKFVHKFKKCSCF